MNCPSRKSNISLFFILQVWFEEKMKKRADILDKKILKSDRQDMTH